MIILNVDAVIANEMAHVFHCLGGREPRLLKRDLSSRFKVVELEAVLIRRIHVIVQMEEESRHRGGSAYQRRSFRCSI